MAKRHVYSKDASGYGEFIYVDLLPEIRRARQFNVNVVAALLFAIILGFFLIYQPYRDGTFLLEELTSENNDAKHAYLLTQEEFYGYEIDIDAINFENDIETISKLRVDLNNNIDTIQLIVDDNNGRLQSVSYDALNDELVVKIGHIDEFRFSSINNQILNIPWVADSTFKTAPPLGDSLLNIGTYTIEVNYDVE
ncbi:hypothetical protein [Candidatus Xianfuyuplasma coldseepsis]|uniref:Uncharacterized protein n=1 Tax=Candidatus Xianfuyuplasma coldseepsis TaxID=2782163 RepID=A0A7L7KVB4_9MOLU|nr:hypothetical protein [Xianfuyuplasma coldseepsis]QMS85924.1 hypothetical protein G4Z02_09245 [Xianfuyuplasma coldseepsis]